MTTTDKPTRNLTDLSRAECQQALRTATLGRIGISQDALPLILPVNYAYDGAHIIFRTGEGGILDRACRNTIVAFEIDEFDVVSGGGWSVSVVGVANVLYGGEWLRALELGLDSVGASEGPVFVRITPGTITGRRVPARATVSRQTV